MNNMLTKEYQIRYCALNIYSDKLKKMGFLSYKDECTSWYKVVNREIINSVYLFSALGCAPLLMEIGYGIHPLFIPAPIPQKLIFTGSHNDEVMREVRGQFKYSFYRETSVMCHSTEERGAELLDTDVFPVFRKAKSELDAYIIHKNIYIDKIKMNNDANGGDVVRIIGSEWLADEAIYFDDKDVQEMMIKQLIWQKECMERGDMYSSCGKLKWHNARIAAIRDGARDSFLIMLEARKRRFIKDLDRKLGIQI